MSHLRGLRVGVARELVVVLLHVEVVHVEVVAARVRDGRRVGDARRALLRAAGDQLGEELEGRGGREGAVEGEGVKGQKETCIIALSLSLSSRKTEGDV